MKKLRKVLSLLLAGVTMVTAMLCGSVSASAASSKTPLLTIALSKIDSKATAIDTLGQDVYWLHNKDTGYSAYYRIGTEEIKAWRSSGKLKATKLTVDDKVKGCTGFYTDSTFIYGNYAIFYTDKNGERTDRIIKYDKAKKTLTAVYSSKYWVGVSSDGYIIDFIWNENTAKLQVKIFNNKLKLVKQLGYDFSTGKCTARWRPFLYGGDTAWITITREDELKSSSGEYLKGGQIIAIDKNGKVKTVLDYAPTAVFAGGNYLSLDRRPIDEISYVYVTSAGKGYDTFDLRYYTDSNNDTYAINGFGPRIYGTKAMAEYSLNVEGSDGNAKYKYAVVDISSAKRLSSVYDYMRSFDDGKTYAAWNSGGKVSILNSKGKKLGAFDDADGFYGKGTYAPVIQDGKIFLVNKKMKQASKTITAADDTYVWTMGEELFAYIYNGKAYIMTNKK